jgi:hypothetical protein
VGLGFFFFFFFPPSLAPPAQAANDFRFCQL